MAGQHSTDDDAVEQLLALLKGRVIWVVWLATLILAGAGSAATWWGITTGAQAPDPSTEKNVAELVTQLGTSLVVAALSAGLIQTFVVDGGRMLKRFVRGREDKQRLTTDQLLLQRLDDVAAGVGSLHSGVATRHLGVDQVGSKRGEVTIGVVESLGSDTTAVEIMGVTLRELLQQQHPLWTRLLLLLRERAESGRKLTIRVLLVDPGTYSLPPVTRHLTTQRARLEQLREDLAQLWIRVRPTREQAEAAGRDYPTLEVKLYRHAPTAFLFATDTAIAWQPYLLPYREGTATPTLRVDPGGVMAAPLRRHFNEVWASAVPLDDVLLHGEVGIAAGAETTGLVNIFASPEEATKRMKHLLRNAKREVWIQGISLAPMQNDPSLELTMAKLFRRTDVTVRLLVMDHKGPQVPMKAFRDYLAAHPPISYAEYARPGVTIFANTPLVMGIDSAVANWRRMLSGTTHELSAYLSGPTGWIMVVDDVVLIEPFHYGSLPRPFTHVAHAPELRLAEEICLMEFKMIDQDARPNPYAVLRDHVEHVQKHLSRPLWPDPPASAG